jgi:hypothetical protein
MATISNIDSLRQTRNQHLDNIKFIARDIEKYELPNEYNVDVLMRYQAQLENEWKRFRLAQEKLYNFDEKDNTQEEAFGYYIPLVARLRNLIKGRQLSISSIPTGSGFPAKCSSSNNIFSSTTHNNDHPINANNTDATAPHGKRFECSRKIALRYSSAIVDFPKIPENSPTILRHLVNTVEKNLRSLNNLGESIELNAIIISLISSKLPASVVQQWELTLPDEEMPRYIHLLDFLRRLECSLRPISTFRGTKRQTCPICKGSHRIWKCDIFKTKSVSERFKIVKAASLCTNCLRKGHSMQDCNARSCFMCGEWHNTLLHRDKRHSKFHSSKPFSTPSSETHQKSTTKNESETPRKDSSPGTSSSHRRTRKQ